VIGFNRPFITQDLPGGEEVWSIVVGYFFRDKYGKKHHVEPHTITDGASIPRILWPLVGHPRGTDIGQAAGLHDVLYREGVLPRKRCDEILVEGMECLGASWMKRKLVYAGIRAGGWKAWNYYRKKIHV
jgi:hypothetical protein